MILAAAAALAGIGGGVAIGLIENDDPEPRTDPAPPASAALDPQPEPADPDPERNGRKPDADLPPPESDPQGLEPGPSGPPPQPGNEQDAADAARAYIQVLDLRSGGATCRSFAPGSLDSLDFPVRRGTCAATVEASLGFRHKGGLPVWRSSQMTNAVSAAVDGQTARVVATIFTRYAGVREPSIEDDMIYLVQSEGRWRIAKPSATIHRAIGNADVPLTVLTPPR